MGALPDHPEGFLGWVGFGGPSSRDITRSDCRKALLFDGGTMRRPHFSYPKKHPAGFFSLLSFFLDRILSLTYPLYSATVDRPATQQAPNDTITRSLSEIRGSSISWQPSHRTLRHVDRSTTCSRPSVFLNHSIYPLTRWLDLASILIPTTTAVYPARFYPALSPLRLTAHCAAAGTPHRYVRVDISRF